jgi:hypothetical protein
VRSRRTFHHACAERQGNVYFHVGLGLCEVGMIMKNRQPSQRLGDGVGAPSVPGAATSAPPLPPTFPPGVNPETYQIETVDRLLRSAAYLSIFSIHNPDIPNVPLLSPRDPSRLIGIEANEELHRFDIRVQSSTFAGGLRASNLVGEPVANVHVKWMVIPDDFEAAPGRIPPPTELDPTRSQRFTFVEGQMTFKDRDRSGFRAFGCGRTFPIMVGGQPQLRVGAVVDVLEAFGKLRGLPGTIVVNGYLAPPQGLFLNFIMRFMDPTARLRAGSSLSSLKEIPDPDPGSTFLVFRGEPDPERPVTLNRAPDGSMIGSNVYEQLRLVHISFDVGTSKSIRSSTREGPVIGDLSATLRFNPMDQNPVTPFTTANGVFNFFAPDGQSFGTLNANIVEGRAFRTELGGAPMPVFRFGGFGPFINGSGQFSGVTGMLTLNGAISVMPRTLSNLYVLRISDTDGRFRAACRAAQW